MKQPAHAPPDASTLSQDSPGLDRVVQEHIGNKLRTLYGELLEQPIPDRLAAIINKLGERR